MNDDPVMTAWEKRQELRLAAEAAPEPADEDVAYAAHVLSEWLDDAAPLHEQRYRDPAKAVLKFAASREQARAPDQGAVARWAQPGDKPNRIWLVMYDDRDRSTAYFDGPDAETLATDQYRRSAPAWNCYLLAVQPDPLGIGPKAARALSTTGGQK